MKIIQPAVITPGVVTFHDFLVEPDAEPFEVVDDGAYQVASMFINVPEDDADLWGEGESYDEGDLVMWEHRVYRAVAASTGVEPGTTQEIPKWADLGPTNRWRMFDEKIGTKTTNPDSIEFVFSPGTPIDSIAFFGIDAAGVSVTVYDAATGVVAHRGLAPVLTDGITDWWTYFNNPIETVEDFILSGLPSNTFYAVEVRLLKPGGIAGAGAIVMGRTVTIGRALYGTSVGIVDYSQKTKDDFGNYTIVERAYSKTADYDIVMNTAEVGAVQRLLAQYRARPLVWIGNERYEATVLYGFYKDFSIVISGPTYSDCSITVEGLT